jgi:hypothetical protein
MHICKAPRTIHGFAWQTQAMGDMFRRTSALVCVACILAIAACGESARARTTPTATTPTATPNLKGAGQTVGGPPIDATPETLPYSFPAVWHNAAGLPLLQTADPSAYAFAPSDGRIGYVCDSVGGRLDATRDGGDTWQAWPISAFSGCSGVFIDAHDASDIFVQAPTTASTNGNPDGYDL